MTDLLMTMINDGVCITPLHIIKMIVEIDSVEDRTLAEKILREEIR